MSDIEVRADHTEEAAEGIRAAIIRGLEEIGVAAEGYAQALTPTETGRLKNSMTHYVVDGEKAVYIGTNVEYGRYVELGVSSWGKGPKGAPKDGYQMLQKAATQHGEEYRAILEKELKG